MDKKEEEAWLLRNELQESKNYILLLREENGKLNRQNDELQQKMWVLTNILVYKGNRLEIGTQQKDVISVIVNKHQTFTLLEKTSIKKC